MEVPLEPTAEEIIDVLHVFVEELEHIVSGDDDDDD